MKVWLRETNYMYAYQCQCSTLLVSSKQLYSLPSDEEHQRLLSMWRVWQFEANNSASHACNAHCLHGSLARSYGVRDLAGPIWPPANANSRPNLVHLKVPSEWEWLELLWEKGQGHTTQIRLAILKSSYDIFSRRISKADVILSSHFAGVRPPSAILAVCCSSRHT